MSGCDYIYKTFSLSTNAGKTSQQRWDLAFLTQKEFTAKYGVTAREYDEIARS